MAKKKKHKAQGEQSAGATSAAVPSSTDVASPAIDRAFQHGNFAEVRRLARDDTGPERDRMLALVKIDRAQLLVGVGTLAFLVAVALLVLRL